jgi:hypothetical protein
MLVKEEKKAEEKGKRREKGRDVGASVFICRISGL